MPCATSCSLPSYTTLAILLPQPCPHLVAAAACVSGVGGGVNGYQLGGTQVWSGMEQSFRTYSQGDGCVRFDIPIGADYTGVMDQLVFV